MAPSAAADRLGLTELSIPCLAHTGAAPACRGESNLRSIRFACFALIIVSPLALVSCGGNKNIAREDQCREQVTLSLSPGVLRTGREMDRLEDDANVKLEYVRSASPTLFVYSLSARGADPGCRSALSRLRQDSHVRFVEPDSRRTVKGFE